MVSLIRLIKLPHFISLSYGLDTRDDGNYASVFIANQGAWNCCRCRFDQTLKPVTIPMVSKFPITVQSSTKKTSHDVNHDE